MKLLQTILNSGLLLYFSPPSRWLMSIKKAVNSRHSKPTINTAMRMRLTQPIPNICWSVLIWRQGKAPMLLFPHKERNFSQNRRPSMWQTFLVCRESDAFSRCPRCANIHIASSWVTMRTYLHPTHSKPARSRCLRCRAARSRNPLLGSSHRERSGFAQIIVTPVSK